MSLISFFEWLCEGAEPTRVLKTQNGSVIRRSKYGVGKDIGGCVYLHRDYVKSLPEAWQEVIRERELERHHYNVVKYDYKNDVVTFINCREFDSVNEPVAGESVICDGKTQKTKSIPQIWHHKWLWVKDDYKGFDVQKSFERSKEWLALPDIPFNKIGSKAVWEKFLEEHGMKP